jgi:hypothetical protein
MYTNQQIVADLLAHMRLCGGLMRDWYVGIAADARDRLFSGHGVKQVTDSWIFRLAHSHLDARAVEEYFHKTIGTRGGPGGGDASTCSVYAYRIAPHTTE